MTRSCATSTTYNIRSAPSTTGSLLLGGVPMRTSLLLNLPAVSGGSWGAYSCADPTSGAAWYQVTQVGTTSITGYLYAGAVDLSTISGATAVPGRATWYCGSGSPCTPGYDAAGLWAAAGPALQTSGWLGRTVTVAMGTTTLQVRLIDVCSCGGGTQLIDLYASAFSQLAPLSTGHVNVTVSW